MSINHTYAVFGLGRYGRVIAKELAKSGAEVMAVDIDENKVKSLIQDVPICKCADITDPEVIHNLGISNVDVVIIAIAGHLETTVMATALCKEAGVKKVIVKCENEIHQKILSRVGADKVVFPENESGIRLAKNLLSSGFIDVMELSDDVSMVELDVRPEWIGKNLSELKLRNKYSMNVVAIRHEKDIITDIDPQHPLEESMKLIVLANNSKLAKLNK